MPFITTALVAGGLAAAGGIGGAAISSHAAGQAASVQADAAKSAAQLQYESAQQALDFQKQQWQTQQQDIAPWLQSGTNALTTMDSLMGLNSPNIPANYGQPQNYGATLPGNTLMGGPMQLSGPPSSTNPAPRPGGGLPASWNPRTAEGGPQSGAIAGGEHSLPFGAPPSSSPNGGQHPAAIWGGWRELRDPASQVPGASPQGAPTGPPSSVGGAQPGMSTGQLVPFSPWTSQFTAPTAATEQNDPGYQFRLDQGTKALQNSAAARGDLLSGNTLQATTQFGQDYASNEYQNVYNRALGQYQQSYNIFENNQANQWNRLAAMAGIGQTAVGQLNSAGQNAANNTGNILLGSAGQIGQQINNSAAATASGYVGGANAWSGAMGNIGNLGMLLPYASLMNQNNPYSTAGLANYPIPQGPTSIN